MTDAQRQATPSVWTDFDCDPFLDELSRTVEQGGDELRYDAIQLSLAILSFAYEVAWNKAGAACYPDDEIEVLDDAEDFLHIVFAHTTPEEIVRATKLPGMAASCAGQMELGWSFFFQDVPPHDSWKKIYEDGANQFLSNLRTAADSSQN